MSRKKRNHNEGMPKTRQELEAEHGPVLGVRELGEKYILIGIAGGTVVVRRKSDALVGTFSYQQRPTLFFDFKAKSGG